VQRRAAAFFSERSRDGGASFQSADISAQSKIPMIDDVFASRFRFVRRSQLDHLRGVDVAAGPNFGEQFFARRGIEI